jgi:hypothetical protein
MAIHPLQKKKPMAEGLRMSILFASHAIGAMYDDGRKVRMSGV